MRRLAPTATHYCWNSNCGGWHGVKAYYRPSTIYEPGEWLPEECPHCFGEISDTRPTYEDAMAGLIDELMGVGVLPLTAIVDDLELFQAVQKELERQASVQRQLERDARIQEAVKLETGKHPEIIELSW